MSARFSGRHAVSPDGGIRLALYDGQEPPEGWTVVDGPIVDHGEEDREARARLREELLADLERSPRWQARLGEIRSEVANEHAARRVPRPMPPRGDTLRGTP